VPSLSSSNRGVIGGPGRPRSKNEGTTPPRCRCPQTLNASRKRPSCCGSTALKPEGAARVNSAPEADARVKFVVSVYVKVKALVDEPAAAVVGGTVMVPVPSPVAAEATPTSSSDDAAEAGIETGMRVLRNRFIGIHLSKTPVRQWQIHWRTVWDHQHAQAKTRRNYRRWF